MEDLGFFNYIFTAIYFSWFFVVLVGISSFIVFIDKRLSHSSWLRKILAFITGVGVDIGGIYVVGFIGLSVAFNNVAVLTDNTTSAEMRERLISDAEFTQSLIYLSTIALGVLASVLGGYVAGKIARQNEIMYGLAIGIGSMLFSIANTFLIRLPTEHQSPVWQLALGLAITIGLTTLGGYLAFMQRKHKQTNLMENKVETSQKS